MKSENFQKPSKYSIVINKANSEKVFTFRSLVYETYDEDFSSASFLFSSKVNHFREHISLYVSTLQLEGKQAAF